MLFAPIVVQN